MLVPGIHSDLLGHTGVHLTYGGGRRISLAGHKNGLFLVNSATLFLLFIRFSCLFLACVSEQYPESTTLVPYW